MIHNTLNNNFITPYVNPEKTQQKRKRYSLETDEKIETNSQKILVDSNESDKNPSIQPESPKKSIKKLKRVKTQPIQTNETELEPTFIGSRRFPKYLKKHILEFLDTNSLNALCLTNKEQKQFVDDLRLEWINKGKIPRDLGFKSIKLFEKSIKNHENKDCILRQAQINRLNKGASLAACGFDSYENLYSSLGIEGAKKIKTIAFLKDHYQNFSVQQAPESNQFRIDVREWALKYPNVERIDLHTSSVVNFFSEDILKQIKIHIPRIVELTTDPFSLNDKNAEQLKDLKNLKILKILQFPTMSSLHSLDFLNDLITVKELTIHGFHKDFHEHQNLSHLNALHLKHLPELSHLLFLNNCTNLKSLSINNCPKIKDFDVLKTLPNLKELSLSNCEDVDLDFLGKIKGLEKLTLTNCGISPEDPEFRWVYDLKFLPELKCLKFLKILNEEGHDSEINFCHVKSSQSLQVVKIENADFSVYSEIELGDFFLISIH